MEQQFDGYKVGMWKGGRVVMREFGTGYMCYSVFVNSDYRAHVGFLASTEMPVERTP